MCRVGLAPLARLVPAQGRRLTSAAMATKRQPSKQRRQSMNQRQRAAIEARRSNAATSAAPEGAPGPAGSGATRRSAGGGSVLSRLRGASATGRGRRTGQPASAQPAGHRAALSALLAAIAAAVIGLTTIQVDVDRAGDPLTTAGAVVGDWARSALDAAVAAPDADAGEVAESIDTWGADRQERYGQAYWPASLGVLLPIIGTALAFRAVVRRAGAKVLNRTMYVTLFGTLLAAGLLLLFLPAVVGVAVAAFQVRKAEVTAARAAAADAPQPGADEVIDVEEVVDEETVTETDAPVEADPDADGDPARRN